MLSPSRVVATAVAALTGALAAPSVDAAELYVPGEFPTIAGAIGAAEDGDVVIVAPGTYVGTVDPVGKAITIRSTDPGDPSIVEQTILDGDGARALQIALGERLDTVVEGFTITGGVEEKGGGVLVFASDPVIRSCVIRNNQADQGGGAYVYASSALFEDCTFVDNTGGDGGAVFAYAGTYVRFERCDFTGNEATSDGGAVRSTFSDVRFQACTFAGNTAVAQGGAYSGANGVGRFVSTLIRDNQAALGGALATFDESPRLVNTTLIRNVATNDGGAIYGIESQPLIRNSIVRDNLPREFFGFGLNPTAEYSNVSGGLPGPGNLDVDPEFVDLSADDFRLQPGSPSVNTGFNGWVAAFSLTDLDGAGRLRQATVDMGAYEIPADEPSAPPAPGSLVVSVRDEGSIAYGVESPLLRYDRATDTWTPVIRNLPAYAITADPERQCFWVQLGENGLLGRIPYDTMELEEIGVLELDGSSAPSLSGLAVRDGVLYGSAWKVGVTPDVLYAIDVDTATLTLVGEFPSEYEVWDLYDDGSRLLVLSSPESVPAGPVGVYELDLDTFGLAELQGYTKDDPFELNALQGLAAGGGVTYLFRSSYNEIEIFDDASGERIDTISIPGTVSTPRGAGWLFGGLTWAPQEVIVDVASGSEGSATPGLGLLPNRPNPFGARTTISYELDADASVRLEVFDVTGRLVQTLVDGRVDAGRNAVSWDGTDRAGRPVVAGVYYVRLRTPAGEERRTLTVLR